MNRKVPSLLSSTTSLLILAVISLTTTSCQTNRCTPPASSAINKAITPHIEKQEVAGAVAMVVTPNKTLHLSSLGLADIATQRPSTPDTIYWIASMTKPVIGVAIMILSDEGKLNINDPASRYIPEIANLKAPDGKAYEVSLRHLLTHTAGLAENTMEESCNARTLADLVPGYAGRQLQFVPGTQWRYSQSGINALGRIIEIVSGHSLPDFLEQRIFKPLGMTDTTFYPEAGQFLRLALPYERQKDGTLKEAKYPPLFDPVNRDHFPAANGGLFSTAPDYARFCQMLLNDGTLNGKRILSPQSLIMLTQVHSGNLIGGFTPGNGWGLGVGIIRQPQGPTAMLSPGTYGHGGAFGTQAWVDPVKKRAYILMVQRSNFKNADGSDIRRDFQQAAADLR